MSKYEDPTQLDYRYGGDTVDDFAQKYMKTVAYIFSALNELRSPTGGTLTQNPEAYQLKVDDNKLYIRNQANTDWILLGDVKENFGFRTSASDAFMHESDVADSGTAGKLIRANASGKLNADILGNAAKIADKAIQMGLDLADEDRLIYDKDTDTITNRPLQFKVDGDKIYARKDATTSWVLLGDLKQNLGFRSSTDDAFLTGSDVADNGTAGKLIRADVNGKLNVDILGNARKMAGKTFAPEDLQDGQIPVYRASDGTWHAENKGTVGTGKNLMIMDGDKMLGEYNGDEMKAIDVQKSSLTKALAESTGYGIVSGCEPSINGLTVTVSAGVIHTADGRRIEVPEQSITLDAADATKPRTDVVYLDTNGTIAKVSTEIRTNVPMFGESCISIGEILVSENTNILSDIRQMVMRYHSTGIVNVKDFGAIGDGVSDDTEPIQNAIYHACENECILLIPSGTYIINETINIDKKQYLSIEGAGIGRTILSNRNKGNSSLIDVSGHHGLQIKNLTLENKYDQLKVINIVKPSRSMRLDKVQFLYGLYGFYEKDQDVSFLEIHSCQFTQQKISSIYIDGLNSRSNPIHITDVILSAFGVLSSDSLNTYIKNAGLSSTPTLSGVYLSGIGNAQIDNIQIDTWGRKKLNGEVLIKTESVFNLSIDHPFFEGFSTDGDIVNLGYNENSSISNPKYSYCKAHVGINFNSAFGEMYLTGAYMQNSDIKNEWGAIGNWESKGLHSHMNYTGAIDANSLDLGYMRFIKPSSLSQIAYINPLCAEAFDVYHTTIIDDDLDNGCYNESLVYGATGILINIKIGNAYTGPGRVRVVSYDYNGNKIGNTSLFPNTEHKGTSVDGYSVLQSLYTKLPPNTYKIRYGLSQSDTTPITWSGKANTTYFPFYDMSVYLITNDVVGSYHLYPFSKNYFEQKWRHNTYGSAAPTSGEHGKGELVWNNAPTPGGYIGWVCTTAGNPGTWKGFGSISS